MLAEKAKLRLAEGQTENAITELNATDVAKVSGGFLPIILIGAAVAIGISSCSSRR